MMRGRGRTRQHTQVRDKNRKKDFLVPFVAETLAARIVSWGHLFTRKVTVRVN